MLWQEAKRLKKRLACSRGQDSDTRAVRDPPIRTLRVYTHRVITLFLEGSNIHTFDEANTCSDSRLTDHVI
jgi:hypothetical protein